MRAPSFVPMPSSATTSAPSPAVCDRGARRVGGAAALDRDDAAALERQPDRLVDQPHAAQRDRAVDHAHAVRARGERRDEDLAGREVAERTGTIEHAVVELPLAAGHVERAVGAARRRHAHARANPPSARPGARSARAARRSPPPSRARGSSGPCARRRRCASRSRGRACRAACGSPRTRRRGCARTRSRSRRSRPATPRAARTSRAAGERASGTTTHAAEAAPAASAASQRRVPTSANGSSTSAWKRSPGLTARQVDGVGGVDGDAHEAGISSGSASRPSARRTARPSASSDSTTSRS